MNAEEAALHWLNDVTDCIFLRREDGSLDPEEVETLTKAFHQAINDAKRKTLEEAARELEAINTACAVLRKGKENPINPKAIEHLRHMAEQIGKDQT